MTENQIKKHLSKRQTERLALRCIGCGQIDIVGSHKIDGHRCPVCGEYMIPIGYVKGRIPNYNRCSFFNCDKQYGNYCCHFCKERDICRNPCLNHPRKCGGFKR